MKETIYIYPCVPWIIMYRIIPGVRGKRRGEKVGKKSMLRTESASLLLDSWSRNTVLFLIFIYLAQLHHEGSSSQYLDSSCSTWAPEYMGSVLVALGLSCSTARGILVPLVGLNPHPLHCKVDSLPLLYRGSPRSTVLDASQYYSRIILWAQNRDSANFSTQYRISCQRPPNRRGRAQCRFRAG